MSASPVADDDASARVLYRLPVQVRWRDLDAFDHVNNANFMTYLEEARIRWFETLDGPWVDAAIAPLLAAVQMQYRQPIPYPADVTVELLAGRAGNTSVTLGHRIRGGRDDGPTYADGHVVLVWIDRASGRPAPLPDAVRAAVSPPASGTAGPG